MVELVGADQFLLIEVLFAVIVHLCLFQVDFSEADTALGTAKLRHVGNDLHLGDDFALCDVVTCLVGEFRNDAADLRFDVHLVSWLDFSSDDGCLLYVIHLRRELLITSQFGQRPLIEVHECTDEDQKD